MRIGDKIRKINCQYFYNVDNHNPGNVGSFFAEDAEVDVGPLATYVGNRLLWGYRE